jgi:DNA-binding protein YbaB
MFQKAKDLYKMQKQAKQIRKKLKQIHVEAEESGVVVVVTAEQELVSLNIPEELLTTDNKKRLEKAIVQALQKANKKAQQISAEEMKEVMGDMGFPGVG